MNFTGLRLSGFKSFVENTQLEIAPGLTGIVGPNGCGKSNLVEALRWAMGENSARRLRGGDMDDVIFGGSRARPARNLAEVSLYINNDDRSAPAQYNDADALEISRQIERGVGSDYKINGKNVRARDVQTLLADLASGASSASLVSQGRIGAIVNAKPTERRQILEEAAGVAGLRTRRREAEQRLQAAETNLARVDDMLGGLESQLAALKKQARQAIRYRSLSEAIRRLEGLIIRGQYQDVLAAAQKASAAQHEADQAIALATGELAAATTRQTNLAAQLPALRDSAAQAAAALQRLVIERDVLARELAQIAQQIDTLAAHRTQIEADLAHERQQLADSDTQQQTLQQALCDIDVEEIAAAGKHDAATAARDDARTVMQTAQSATDALRADYARVTAERNALSRTLEQVQKRLAENAAATARLAQEMAETTLSPDAAAAQETADTALDTARLNRDTLAETLDQLTTVRAEREQAVATARNTADAARMELARAQAEFNALNNMLADSGAAPDAVIDNLRVPAGLEAAIAIALGDAAQAGLNHDSASYWQELPSYADGYALPDQVENLSAIIGAPPALNRALSQIGLVENTEQGMRLVSSLKPGQLLVTRAGDQWRWDGFTIKANAPSAATRRLQQRNRLDDLSKQLTSLEHTAKTTAHSLEHAEAARTELLTRENAARADYQQARAAADAAQTARDDLHTAHAAATQRRAAQAQQSAQLAETKTTLVQERNEALNALGALTDDEALQRDLRIADDSLQTARDILREADVMVGHLEFQHKNRALRTTQISRDIKLAAERHDKTAVRITDLETRAAQAVADHAALAARPADMAAQQEQLQQQILSQEVVQAAAAVALADGEAALASADSSVKETEARLATARENRIRLDTAAELAQHKMQELDTRADELAQVAARDLAETFVYTADELAVAVDQARDQLDKNLRARDAIGPVNLRAEFEASELEQQLATVGAEKAELVAAIARLRGGIGHLNREARELLRSAFNEVSTHFTQLFTRMFNGGTAELKLVDSDDPLEAGLEIIAQPPGKKLQSLTLLSGGEQALTALALIFAMFKTKPAPICVLDEVDAPLDDANVDRFCNLLHEMAADAQTRFLVITHHRLTMARMHRLYGVTMSEPGVSQLVSVDLDRAAAIVEQQAA